MEKRMKGRTEGERNGGREGKDGLTEGRCDCICGAAIRSAVHMRLTWMRRKVREVRRQTEWTGGVEGLGDRMRERADDKLVVTFNRT